jgi:rare lipoprotein A
MHKVILLLLLSLIIPTSCYAGSQSGKISYYSEGTKTASGERFNKHAMTCAHRRLPFGTMVRVEYRGKVVTCRVNDRGPFIGGRVLDLSLGAASALGIRGAGVVYASIAW